MPSAAGRLYQSVIYLTTLCLGSKAHQNAHPHISCTNMFLFDLESNHKPILITCCVRNMMEYNHMKTRTLEQECNNQCSLFIFYRFTSGVYNLFSAFLIFIPGVAVEQWRSQVSACVHFVSNVFSGPDIQDGGRRGERAFS